VSATHVALEHRFRIEHDERGSLLRRLVAGFELPEPDEGVGDVSTYRLVGDEPEATAWCDEIEIVRGPLRDVASRLLTRINVAAIRSVDDRLVGHAAVVEVDGGALVLMGNPGAGKSTLVAALAQRGFAYASDEAAPLGADGSILPYAKPIVVGRGSFGELAGAGAADIGEVGAESTPEEAAFWFLDAEALGAAVVRRPLPLRFLVVPRYDPGSVAELEPMTRAEAVAAFASNSFNLARHGRAGLEMLRDVSGGVRAAELTHGSATAAVDVLGQWARS